VETKPHSQVVMRLNNHTLSSAAIFYTKTPFPLSDFISLKSIQYLDQYSGRQAMYVYPKPGCSVWSTYSRTDYAVVAHKLICPSHLFSFVQLQIKFLKRSGIIYVPPPITLSNSAFFPTRCIYWFRIILRINHDYFP
jgi:hypothetical protein